MISAEEKIKQALMDAGFDVVGITDASPLVKEDVRLRSWIEAGFAGEMDYMKRNPSLRSDPASLLPGAQSVVVAAGAYVPPDPPGPVAGYALYRDYHLTFREALGKGVEKLRDIDDRAESRIVVDTAPLLERALACKAGLGRIGYSTNLITPGFGPFVQLGSIITTVDLEPDGREVEDRCEDCGRCIEACPTGALVKPFSLDARRCISYLTIEKKGPFNDWEAAALDGWAFGCDLCLLSCQEDRGSPPSLLERNSVNHDLEGLLDQCESGFKRGFKDTPLFRCGRSRLVRNILSAATNLRLPWAAARARAHLAGGTYASREAARRAGYLK